MDELSRQRSGVWKSLKDVDFEEEEIWDVLRETKTSTTTTTTKSIESKSSIPIQRRSLSSASKMIPKSTTSSSSELMKAVKQQQQQSAPVNIPEWSKIKRKKSTNSWLDHEYYSDNVNSDNELHDDDDEEEISEIESSECYYKLMPPHEMIARRLARSQISSFSVFEGVGRTLKGRDLSKVRNAILIKTGFLESL